MASKPDIAKFNLMLITDRHRSRGRDNFTVIHDALEGGVRLFQLREPDLTSDEIQETASLVLPEIRSAEGILIINDHIDVCLMTDADGVHLGANDLPIPDARKMLGEDKLIGFSAHTREQAIHAVSDGADYLTLSPAFSLKHKESQFPPYSPDELWAIADEVGISTFFLGGINSGNVTSLKKYDKNLKIAVVSAITEAEEIKGASANMLDGIR